MRRRIVLGLLTSLCLLLAVPSAEAAYTFGAGVTDKIDTANDAVTKAGTSFSIAVRFKINAANSTKRNFALYDDAAGTQYNFWLKMENGATNQVGLGFSKGGGVTFPEVLWTSGFAAGSTHTLVGTYDGSNLRIYADTDATAKATLAETGTPDQVAGQAFRMGNDPGGPTQSMDGTLYEVAWWPSTTLTGAQAAQFGAGYDAEYSASPALLPTPTSHWRLFGIAADTTTPDNLAGKTGTITGAAYANTDITITEPYPVYYGNGANNVTAGGTHASTLATTIPATILGHDLVVSVGNGDNPNPAATVSSVTATGATFSKLGAIGNTLVNDSTNAEVWVARGVPAGITSVTVNWSAVTVGVVSVGEYAAVKSLGKVVTVTGTAANPTVSLTTQDANNLVVAALSREGTGIGPFTGLTGFIRASGEAFGDGAPDNDGALVDNSSTTPASVTCAVTQAGVNPWAAVAVELRSLGPGRRVMQY